jgi:hypothetical protein
MLLRRSLLVHLMCSCMCFIVQGLSKCLLDAQSCRVLGAQLEGWPWVSLVVLHRQAACTWWHPGLHMCTTVVRIRCSYRSLVSIVAALGTARCYIARL